MPGMTASGRKPGVDEAAMATSTPRTASVMMSWVSNLRPTDHLHSELLNAPSDDFEEIDDPQLLEQLAERWLCR